MLAFFFAKRANVFFFSSYIYEQIEMGGKIEI